MQTRSHGSYKQRQFCFVCFISLVDELLASNGIFYH